MLPVGARARQALAARANQHRAAYVARVLCNRLTVATLEELVINVFKVAAFMVVGAMTYFYLYGELRHMPALRVLLGQVHSLQ